MLTNISSSRETQTFKSTKSRVLNEFGAHHRTMGQIGAGLPHGLSALESTDAPR